MPDLWLAPIQETGVVVYPIYTWVEKLDRDKAQFEIDRLLYVAATRAKKFLHLLGHVNGVSDDHGNTTSLKPLQGSLLQRLWPIVQPIYSAAATDDAMSLNRHSENRTDNPISATVVSQSIFRLKIDWVLPDAPESITWQESRDKKHIQEEI